MGKIVVPPTKQIEIAPIPLLDERTGDARKKRFVTVSRAEKWLIEKARQSPEWFIYYLTAKRPAKHHNLWLNLIFNFSDEAREQGKFRLNFIAPRESAKTTILMYALVWYISKFPWMTNLIVSVSAKQAEARLEMIRDIIEHDTRFKNVFPHIKIDERQRNTVSEFTIYAEALHDEKSNKWTPINYNVWRSLVKRVGSAKDPTLYACGNGGKGVIGRRISGILILDDIIDENYLKATLQDEVMDYIARTLVPCVMETGKVIYIGTRWMLGDVPEQLKSNPEWYTVEIQALRYDNEGIPHSYWEEYWPVEKLLAKKREINNDALFNVMYLNDPQALTSAKFTLGGLSQSLPPVLPKFVGLYIGTDFAISLKQEADWTVFAAVALDVERNIYILDMQRMKATPDKIVAELGVFAHSVNERFSRLDRILIENVAFQTNYRFNIVDKFPHLPAESFKPIGDKGHRAEQLANRANDGRVFINKEMTVYKQLLSEALNFPLHRHDDCLDAITIVLQYTGVSASAAQVKIVRSPFLL